jgi:hypothetical protein
MLNPNEQFVVKSLKRSQIARCFNDVIDEHQLNMFLFSSGDCRLTTEVCTAVVDAWADLVDQGMSNEDLGAAQRDAMRDIIEKHFPC